ncbi:MFS transporter [Arthrobacter sp. BE255]|uniref:MFS transporter n=1 Tax=Arthrobacter sp. BE255 TaxID=2817721 RepID=UPI00286351AD|nr:MFS transporter [Arthrobacter sp. BE255]MDR7161970.1 DHA1 family inner membrane transport protein [Arthrobacter sp. BE255]
MAPDSVGAVTVKSRNPLATFVLAGGTFLMGTTEFIVAGLLPTIAADLGVTVADAGLMITVFAIGMVVGTPLMAVLMLKLSQRTALCLSLVIFAIGHVIVATTSDFALVLSARVVTALATGAFWAVAAVVASREAGPEESSRAVGIVISVGMLANVIGVPVGSLAGQFVGWRGPFWILAALAGLGLIAVYRTLMHNPPETDAVSDRAEFKALQDVRVWLVLACCVAVNGASYSAYSYLVPLLMVNTGLPEVVTPFVLLGYGVGAFIGSYTGGHLGARRPYSVLFATTTGTLLVLGALCLVSQQSVLTICLTVLLGLFGVSMHPILIAMAVRLAAGAPTLASALCTSFLNLGTAVGSWSAGLALESELGVLGPVVVGTAIAALCFIPLGLLASRQRQVVSA